MQGYGLWPPWHTVNQVQYSITSNYFPRILSYLRRHSKKNWPSSILTIRLRCPLHEISSLSHLSLYSVATKIGYNSGEDAGPKHVLDSGPIKLSHYSHSLVTKEALSAHQHKLGLQNPISYLMKWVKVFWQLVSEIIEPHNFSPQTIQSRFLVVIFFFGFFVFIIPRKF